MRSGRHCSFPAFACAFTFILLVVMNALGMSSYRTGVVLRKTLLFPSTTTEVAKTTRTSRLGDGCYHVFMDVGANIGVHGRFLFEPHLYPDSKSSVPFFDTKYGQNRSNEDYCVFSIEANPSHWPRLKNLSDAYAAVGWRLNYVQAAAGDQNGTMVFYHQGQHDTVNSEWGFSLRKGGAEDATAVDVPTVRLAEWIQHEVLEREVPEIPPSGRHYPKPILGIKMDIEGSEYIVLPDLMLSGVFCQLDYLFGEGHAVNSPYNFAGQRADLSTVESTVQFEAAMRLVLHGSRNCQAEYLPGFDDESYLHDGMPFPDPN